MSNSDEPTEKDRDRLVQAIDYGVTQREWLAYEHCNCKHFLPGFPKVGMYRRCGHSAGEHAPPAYVLSAAIAAARRLLSWLASRLGHVSRC
jgi:hypothetical protein